jgi:hypothetical protein
MVVAPTRRPESDGPRWRGIFIAAECLGVTLRADIRARGIDVAE